MIEMIVPPAMKDTLEDILHTMEPHHSFCFLLTQNTSSLRMQFQHIYGHRAIGVVYNPCREAGNYVPTVLSDRYDAFVFFHDTKALHPLHHIHPHYEKIPETYPFGV